MKPGRNDPCSCGSGKKYRLCCEGKAASRSPAPAPDELKQLVSMFRAGRYAELESRAGSMLGQYPDSGFAWKLLGASLQAQGKDALQAFQKTAGLMPNDPDVHLNLGLAQKNTGRLGDAEASYRRALKLDPGYAEAHNNLGHVLKDLGQLDGAVASYRRALQINPGFAIAHNNLGTALKDLGQLDGAVASYRRALQIKPDYAEAHYNLGIALMDLGQLEEAVASYRRALQIRPDYVKALINLGNSLKELGQFNEGVACYYRAAEIRPDFADAHGSIGSALKELGQFEGAIASYRRALELKPDFADVYSCLLFTLNYSACYSPSYCLDEARRYGRMVSGKVDTRFTAWRCADSPVRLRVGLVSGDLRNHPVGYFLESLLAHLDPGRIELIAYQTDLKADALTVRIKPYFTAWKPLFGLNDAGAARLIHADGVHVLMDLSGHSRHGRLPMFAWKPAPVQAAWLGYFATTGVSEIDYLLADPVGMPEAHQKHFTETVWYLPDTRLCFSPPEIDLPVSSLPAIKNSHVTFGCFQDLTKVGDEVLAAWAKILIALPDSRLRWQCKQLGDPVFVEQLIKRLQQHGIDPARAALHGAVSREAYLAAHSEVDLILDTFPYPGGTTTCEALWMGVPTLTLAGDTLLSRQGASLLTAAGLVDWIATSRDDYVNRTLALASDLPKLAALRVKLRDQARTSPLFDAPRFAHNLEEALWGMWQSRGLRSTQQR